MWFGKSRKTVMDISSIRGIETELAVVDNKIGLWFTKLLVNAC